MMCLFTVKDNKAEVFNPPFNARSHDEAMRMMLDTMQSGDTLLSRYPYDFDLYYICDFDEQNGILEKTVNVPLHVINLQVLLAKHKAQQIRQQRDMFGNGDLNAENGRPYDSEDQTYTNDEYE